MRSAHLPHCMSSEASFESSRGEPKHVLLRNVNALLRGRLAKNAQSEPKQGYIAAIRQALPAS